MGPAVRPRLQGRRSHLPGFALLVCLARTASAAATGCSERDPSCAGAALGDIEDEADNAALLQRHGSAARRAEPPAAPEDALTGDARHALDDDDDDDGDVRGEELGEDVLAAGAGYGREWRSRRRTRRRSIAGKSVYLVMTDRFNRVGGYQPGNLTACSGADWCNGTLAGITEQIPYIKGMGFDCIWVTPPVKNFGGYDGQSGWGYAGYWAEDYYDIDPHFGTRADLKRLVRRTHAYDMCFILDIVVNHVRPVHSEADVAMINPFNKIEYFHQLDIGDMTFEEYTEKKSDWPPPTQALGVGAMCAVTEKDGTYDYTNGGQYCNNYDPASDFTPEAYRGADAPGPPDISYCGTGDLVCTGYNQTRVYEGWFYDLGDLNQTVPVVREGLLDWAEYMATEYRVDGIRLDTAPYVTPEFLQELQARLDSLDFPIEIIGEVTTTNVSFHAAFQRDVLDGKVQKILAGMENFPLNYYAQPGYCGYPGSVGAPFSQFDLTLLGKTTLEQLFAVKDFEPGIYLPIYSDPDLLMNFMDNQDSTPVAGLSGPDGKTGGCIGDDSRVMNSLAWVFMARGMPVLLWGDEQGNKDYRNSLWQFGWKRDTWQYKYITQLNEIRKQYNLGLESAMVAEASTNFFVFWRGKQAVPSAWIATNNLAASSEELTYNIGPPLPPQGHKWVNALTGKAAKFATCQLGGQQCLVAENTEPQILVLRRCR